MSMKHVEGFGGTKNPSISRIDFLAPPVKLRLFLFSGGEGNFSFFGG